MKKLFFLIMGGIFFVFPEQIYSEETKEEKSIELSGFTKEIDTVEHHIKQMDEKIIALSAKSALQKTEVENAESALKEAAEKMKEAAQTQKFYEEQVEERLKTTYKNHVENQYMEKVFPVQNNEKSLNEFYYIRTLLSLDQKELQKFSLEAEKSREKIEKILEIKNGLTEEKEKMEKTEAKLKKEMEEKEIYLHTLYSSEKQIEEKPVPSEEETEDTSSEKEAEEVRIVDSTVNEQKTEPDLPVQKNSAQPETEFIVEESIEKIEDLEEMNIVMGWKRTVPHKEKSSSRPEEQEKFKKEEGAEKETEAPDVSEPAGSVIFHRPADGRITSPFNPSRVHPITGEVRAHNGTDFGRDGGTNIYAAESGTVTASEWRNGLGNAILLAHTIEGKTYATLYGHLASMHVKEGDYVERGEIIAVMGTTGLSTGVHLHFEVHPGGYRGGETAVDPEKYLQ